MNNWNKYNQDKFSVLSETYDHHAGWFRTLTRHSVKHPGYDDDPTIKAQKIKNDFLEKHPQHWQDQDKELKTLHGVDLHSSEDAKHQDVIHNYTRMPSKYNNGNSEAINKYLLGTRNINNKPMDNYVKNLDHALAHFSKPLPEDAHVYSGLQKWSPADHFKQSNGIIHMPTFTSTSIKPEVAYSFGVIPNYELQYSNIPKEQHVLHFHLPAGSSHGVYVEHMSDHMGEHEYLLKRNQKWKLTNHEVVKDTRFVNHSNTNKIKHIIKTHIWSVEPHNDKVNESLDFNISDSQNRETDNKVNTIYFNSRLPSDLNREKTSIITKPFTDEQLKVAKKFIRGSDLNHHLLSHASLSQEDQHDYNFLHELCISQPPLNQMHHVFSGLGKFDLSHYYKGGMFQTAAFLSCSLDPRIAIIHSQGFVHEHILHIQLPKGFVGGVYIGDKGIDPREAEYLLAPNIQFTFTGTETINVSGQQRTFWSVIPKRVINEAYSHYPEIFKDDTNDDTYDLVSNDINKQHKQLKTKEPNKIHQEIADHILDSSEVNKALITASAGKKPKAIKEHNNYLRHADNLSNTIKKLSIPLEKDAHMYSGISKWNIKPEVGSVFHTPAFTSTSINPLTATEFTDHHLNILHFHLPKGYNKGLYLGHHAASINKYNDEREYLLDKGQKWKVHHKEKIGSYKITTLIPHDESLNEAFKHDLNHPGFVEPKGGVHDIENGSAYLSYGHEYEHDLLSHEHEIGKLGNHEDTIKTYTGSYSNELNTSLIKNLPLHDKLKNLHDNLQKIAENNPPLSRTYHTYSGLDSKHPAIKAKNSIVHFPAYTSTSINPEIAMIHGDRGTMDIHVAHFELPKDYRGARYIAKHSCYPNEHEMLLDANQSFKHVGSNSFTNENGHNVHVHTFKPLDHIFKDISETYEHKPERFSGSVITSRGHVLSHAIAQPDRLEIHTDIPGDVQAQHEHLSKQLPKFSFSEKLAIKHYTHNNSTNHYLINKYKTSVGAINNDIKSNHIKSGMHASKLSQIINDKAPSLDHEVHVYSGLKDYNPKEHFKDSVIYLPAFTSTSIDPMTSIGFRNHSSKETHILHFHLPVGYRKGLYVDPHSTHSGEHEYLLDKGQDFKLTGVKTSHVSFKDKNEKEINTHAFHVWSLEPHDASLNETFEHKPEIFNSSTSKQKQDKFNDVQAHSKSFGVLNLNEADLITLKRHLYSSTQVNKALIAKHSGTEFTPSSDMPELDYGEPTAPTDHAGFLKRADELSNLIHKHSKPLEQPGHFYSGTYRWDISHLKPGNELHTPAFTSASLDPTVAHSFSNIPGNRSVIHFHLPAGYNKGIHAPSFTKYHNSEHEYLLDKDQKWKVHHVEKQGDTNIITVKPHDDK